MYDDFRMQSSKYSTRTKSKVIVESAFRYTSSHARTRIDPLVFSRGSGPFLKDVDDNVFLDFASGIYVTNLGHSHPKIAEAISIEASKLMNCHDYMTPVKAAYLEKLSGRTNNIFDNIHFYDNGTTAVEIAIKMARSITGKHEIISFIRGEELMSTPLIKRLKSGNYFTSIIFCTCMVLPVTNFTIYTPLAY